MAVCVQLVFRKKIPSYFSIENVFSILLPFFGNEIEPVIVHAPFIQGNPAAVFRNLISLRKKQAPVVHVTGDIHYAVFAYPSQRTILTIHDCVFLYSKNGLRKFIFLWVWLKLPVKHAHYITTISEASKKDILQYTGCDPSKVLVIPDPVDQDFIFTPKEFNKQKPVILQMGTWPNKNLERVVRAITDLNCHFVIIGKLSDLQIRLLKECRIDYSNWYQLSKADLIDQYKRCDLVVFMSTFEGFGLPVIEAQAIGRPLITSALAPMNEIAGDGAAHFADPLEVGSIREGILKVMNDEAYRIRLVEKARQNILRFDPAIIASRYSLLYQKVAAESKKIKP